MKHFKPRALVLDPHWQGSNLKLKPYVAVLMMIPFVQRLRMPTKMLGALGRSDRRGQLHMVYAWQVPDWDGSGC
jgi:hypothetical protein